MAHGLLQSRVVTGLMMAGALLLGCAHRGLGRGPGDGVSRRERGREFRPKAIVLQRGDVMTIVNDDADLRHHVYIHADSFTFNSGDQEAGEQDEYPLSAIGTFDVLCAIHPKMKLTVQVE